MASSLLPTENATWIRSSTWLCCEIIVMHFLTKNSLLIASDVPVQFKVMNKSVYTYSTQRIPHYDDATDMLLIHRGYWNAGGLPKFTAKALIVTDSLDLAHKLMNRNRINAQAVVLQSQQKCDVFTWFPYQEGNCRNPPQLQWISECDNITGLFVPSPQSSGCPLIVSLVTCPVYVERAENGTLYGAEITILQDLAHYLNMEFVPYVPGKENRERLWYYTKYNSSGALSGVWSLVDEDTVDMGGACQSMGNDKVPLGCLPCHIEDATAWHLPTTQSMHLSYGFITAMPTDLWAAQTITFIVAIAFGYLGANGPSFGFTVLWTVIRSLSMPSPPLRENFSFRFFSIVLEMGYLILTSSYRSFLLYNLFLKPIFQIETGEQGAEEGLLAYIRLREAELLRNINHSQIYKELMERDTLRVAQTYDFEKLVVDKTSMFMARTILDQAQIRRNYPNVSYTSVVYVEKQKFTINKVIFLLHPYHPLFEELTSKMLDIIEAGLPEVYLQRTLAMLPGKGGIERPNHQQPLGIRELASVFYFWLIGLILCIAASIMEIIFHAYFGSKNHVLNKSIHKFQLRLTKIQNHQLSV